MFGTSPVSDVGWLVISLKNARGFMLRFTAQKLAAKKRCEMQRDCSIVLPAALRVLEKEPRTGGPSVLRAQLQPKKPSDFDRRGPSFARLLALPKKGASTSGKTKVSPKENEGWGVPPV